VFTYYSNDTCVPGTNAADSCTLGYYGVYVVVARSEEHVKTTLDFAREHNLRFVVRNTGHDFLGRSVGWGTLVVNTHNLQGMTWINAWNGPGNYTGRAVTVGAGVQARDVLAVGNKRSPPQLFLSGECGVSVLRDY
jgi:FAD/FMN-containing dehydrogenase